jgi:hypothetical protein
MCPDNCQGIENIEGPRAFASRNIKTGRVYEWRICDSEAPLSLYAGYVIEISYIERGSCQDIDSVPSKPPYHIIRGKELDRVSAYSIVKPFVNFDGDDRPVLAKNCWNSPDDSTTICSGDGAQFVREISQR